jgi:BirA family biotin operon repressor/biotin-[acetyl-CoA-carboxylase] ligase
MLASYYEVNGKEIKLKWPNDVMVTKPENGKLAGILVEKHGDAVVLGIGLNVNEPQDRKGVDPAASYVTYVANIKRLDTADFGREFLEQFYALYEQWLAKGFAPLKDEFNDAMLLNGRTMEIVDALGNSLAKGIAQGVDERGYLLLEREDGSVQAVASGEVHVLC